MRFPRHRFGVATVVFAALSACAGNGSGNVPVASGTTQENRSSFQSDTLRPSPSAAKGLSVLYSFGGAPDGANPLGGVLIDAHGDIFGTTYQGGSSGNNFGTVYELTPSGKSYVESIIYTFAGPNGAFSYASPTEDTNGNLFVTTSEGGPSGTDGTATELSPTSNGYEETASYGFISNGGEGPWSTLLQHGATLYTTTYVSGANNFGSIAALTASGLNETDLYDFKGPPDGAEPTANLVMDSTGALYGTTNLGGKTAACTDGCGTVFKYVPSKDGGTEKVIYRFAGGTTDGKWPWGGVVLDKKGNLYGTTWQGGSQGYGIIYKLTPKGSSYKETILHTFTGPPDGDSPWASLTLDGTTLYGTTAAGGKSTGCACGTIFKISTSGANYQVLHRFDGSDGQYPYYSPLVINGSALYGTTEYGGSTNNGVVFRFVP